MTERVYLHSLTRDDEDYVEIVDLERDPDYPEDDTEFFLTIKFDMDHCTGNLSKLELLKLRDACNRLLGAS